ncbi:MAG: cupredoxin domain-containing protein [Actinobacteria bacterium]|nr:cupredoxin domain-containing protein [Actinomycetota bacterium]
MRRLLVGLVAASALTIAAPAMAATKPVTITKNGFTPSSVTIDIGDTVTWRNSDAARHQVVAENGAFASPILRLGQSYSFTFQAAGTYRYRDSYNSGARGTVTVNGAPPSVSIAASQPIVLYGGQVRIAGQVSTKRAGETVRLLARPYPQSSFAEVAQIVTTADGQFDYLATPKILSAYQVSWRGASSIAVTVEVKPKVVISYARATGVFTTRVTGGSSYAGKSVYLQRLSSLGQWVNIKKVTLNLYGSKRFFAPTLPKGLSRVRIFMTVNQAGAGYLSSMSGTWSLTRR